MDKMCNKFIKSPLNYIGGKYKLLPQIISKFPNRIESFIDLFAGGLDVSININNANNIYSNDINCYLIDIYKVFQNSTIDYILSYITDVISKYNLSTTNQDGYLELRTYYNNVKYPLDLYILACYSFNHQVRFNNKHEFNVPFGRNRSSFNSNIRQNLINFHNKITKIHFQSLNFIDYNIKNLSTDDFVYADPPYLISCGSYNDGKRGFNAWNQSNDIELFSFLDELNKYNIKFALSNITKHKGIENYKLLEWKNKYNTHYINMNYNNSNYNVKNKNNITEEILVTNY